jgi:peptidoglycan/LPS O-acetylase OafA/YrhL
VLEKFAGMLPKMLAGPIVSFSTFAICAASWYCLEQPIMRLKRLFRERSVAAPLEAAGTTHG